MEKEFYVPLTRGDGGCHPTTYKLVHRYENFYKLVRSDGQDVGPLQVTYNNDKNGVLSVDPPNGPAIFVGTIMESTTNGPVTCVLNITDELLFELGEVGVAGGNIDVFVVSCEVSIAEVGVVSSVDGVYKSRQSAMKKLNSILANSEAYTRFKESIGDDETNITRKSEVSGEEMVYSYYEECPLRPDYFSIEISRMPLNE